MAKFAYNNTKNTSIGYTFFKFNCGFHSQVLFEEDVNSCSRSRLANKLADKLRELIEIVVRTFFMYMSYRKKSIIKK